MRHTALGGEGVLRGALVWENQTENCQLSEWLHHILIKWPICHQNISDHLQCKQEA